MKPIIDIRLREKDIDNIKNAFGQSFLPGDQLWIFGSRVYPEKRGGDIDLYVETQIENISEALKAKSKFWVLLQDNLGEQKIDVVLNYVGSAELLIYKVARNEEIRLI